MYYRRFLFLQGMPETPRRCMHCHPIHVPSTPSNYVHHPMQYYTPSHCPEPRNGVYTPHRGNSYHGGESFLSIRNRRFSRLLFDLFDLEILETLKFYERSRSWKIFAWELFFNDNRWNLFKSFFHFYNGQWARFFVHICDTKQFLIEF